VIPRPRWEDFLDLSLEEIRFYGGNSVQVMRRIKVLISDLILALPQERHRPLQMYQQRLDAAIGKAFMDTEDRQQASSKTGKDWVLREDILSRRAASRQRVPREQ
jgi:hypothetical protein